MSRRCFAEGFEVFDDELRGVCSLRPVLVEPIHQSAAERPLPAVDPLDLADQIGGICGADELRVRILRQADELPLQLGDASVALVLYQVGDDVGAEAQDKLGLVVLDQPVNELEAVALLPVADPSLWVERTRGPGWP